jgi:hypothetical protein
MTSTAIGRLFIRLQSVVPELDFTSDTERDEFLDDYAQSLPERMRQSVLTWRANRATGNDLQRSQEIDRARRNAPT